MKKSWNLEILNFKKEKEELNNEIDLLYQNKNKLIEENALIK